VHGGRDTDVPPARASRFCESATASGSRCEVRIVDGAIHRAENWLPTQWDYKDDLVKWLTARVGLERPDHESYPAPPQKDIVYDPERGLKFDAWSPSGKGPFPAVVIAHGGGWEAGDKVTYLTPVLEPLARAGFAWFSIDYRLTPYHRNPDQLEDLLLAVRGPHDRTEDAHREELPAGAGQHDGLDVLVAREAVDDILQAEQHLAGEAVVIRRAIERHDGHAVVALTRHITRHVSA